MLSTESKGKNASKVLSLAMYLCACVCMYVYMCICLYTCMHMWMSEINLKGLPWLPSPLFFETVSHSTWNSLTQLGWITKEISSDIFVSDARCWVAHILWHPGCVWVLVIQIQASYFCGRYCMYWAIPPSLFSKYKEEQSCYLQHCDTSQNKRCKHWGKALTVLRA